MSAGVDASGPDRRPRIALMSGICVRHDAISNVVRAQEEILASAGYDVRVYVQHTDFPGGRHHAVSDPWLLQRDDWYVSADLVVLHFGINYGLFDSLGLTHRGVRVVHFHNVTPPDLLHGDARDAAVRGIDQLSIAARADRIWSDSAVQHPLSAGVDRRRPGQGRPDAVVHPVGRCVAVRCRRAGLGPSSAADV